jgi:hypothetical protein
MIILNYIYTHCIYQYSIPRSESNGLRNILAFLKNGPKNKQYLRSPEGPHLEKLFLYLSLYIYMSKHCIYVNIYYTYAYKYIYIHTCFQVGYTSVTLIFRLFPIYSRSPSSAASYDESSRRIYNAAKPAQGRFEQKNWIFFGGGNWRIEPYLHRI